MSAQTTTYNEQTIQKYDKAIVNMSNNLLRKKRFGIGKGPSADEYNQMLWLKELYCGDCCHYGHMKDKIGKKLAKLILKNL